MKSEVSEQGLLFCVVNLSVIKPLSISACVGVYVGFDVELSHRIEAGSDFFLMPSRFEPCGLNQMYSMKYATIPIVNAVGGLDDTVEDFNVKDKFGNGIKFKDCNKDTLLKLRRLLIK